MAKNNAAPMMSSEDRDTWPIQVDPPGCGCTECLIGQYVPLDRATSEQVIALLCGELGSGLSPSDLQLRVKIQFAGWGARWASMSEDELVAHAEVGTPQAKQMVQLVRDLKNC